MLDLNAPVRTVRGVDLAADHADRGVFHAFPASPRVALRDGRPDLELLRFVSAGSLTGGHLRLGIELSHPDGTLDEVAALLTSERPGLSEPYRMVPVAVQQAKAQLLFIGTEPNDQGGTTGLLARPYGEVTAEAVAPHHATFALDLTADGVRLMEAALRSGAAPIAVVARLSIEGLWPAQRVVARVDWGRTYDHFSSHFKEGNLLQVNDVAQLIEELREDRSIVVQAVQSLTPEQSGGASDLDVANAWIQRELVERFCEPVMPLSRTPAHVSLGTAGEIFGIGTEFAAKRLTQVERAVATVDFQRALVLNRTYTLQSHLADVLGTASLDDLVVDARLDHPFFQRFAIRVRAAAPLPELGLAEVVGDLAYGTASLPVRLTPELTETADDCWADASPDHTWTLQATARFAADAPLDPGREVTLPLLDGHSRDLTLDLEQLLGLVHLHLNQPPDPRVLLSRITLRHWRCPAEQSRWEQRAERELVLTPDVPAGTIWLRDRQPGDRIEATVQHLLADGRSLPGETVTVDSTQVLLPPAIPTALSVQLIATDDWAVDGVQRVAVALQRDENAPALTVFLEGPGALATANLDLPDPTDQGYRYRTTRTLVGGGVQEDGWVQSDRPVLLIGGTAGNSLVVDITPIGPELPTVGVLLIEVEVVYLDVAHQLRAAQTYVVRALADRPRWEVPIVDPSRRSYDYRITVHRASGAVHVGSWTTATDRMLVVPVTLT